MIMPKMEMARGNIKIIPMFAFSKDDRIMLMMILMITMMKLMLLTSDDDRGYDDNIHGRIVDVNIWCWN
jgi:hypothetical protein